jgi:hypothetical protein
MTKPVHWCAAAAFVLAALTSTVTFAACTRDQAFNRMMALNQYGMTLQSDLPDPLADPHGYNAKYPRVTDFNTRLASVGKTLAAPVAANQMMTLLATTSSRGAVAAGHVIAPLKLADSAQAALLQPGDVVDVVGAGAEAEQAAVIAARARVVTVPEVPDDRAGPAPEGALVLVDVDAQTATALAQAAASATLSIIWR